MFLLWKALVKVSWKSIYFNGHVVDASASARGFKGSFEVEELSWEFLPDLQRYIFRDM